MIFVFSHRIIKLQINNRFIPPPFEGFPGLKNFPRQRGTAYTPPFGLRKERSRHRFIQLTSSHIKILISLVLPGVKNVSVVCSIGNSDFST